MSTSIAPAEEGLTLATVLGAYGIKGWVRLWVNLEDPSALTHLSPLTLHKPSGHKPAGHQPSDVPAPAARPVIIEALQRQGKGYTARLSGVEDRTAAEALKGSDIRMPTAQFPQADDGDFYWRDLEGLQVWCEEGESRLLLGIVQRLLETGANDVLVVTPSEGSIDDRERLIPWLPDEVIKQVDLQERTIAVSWFIDA
ncbi:ribosome maturation factor RimM [Luminiphilus sp.]|nr:ribosome maturation factor RimM [Luminiphilus sp.]MDA8678429.1 ribosome maturation factor RimM [Luminiphilus sp.]MDA9219383.1 ribosome maturation factor RimM [Luminiphilus sp.]